MLGILGSTQIAYDSNKISETNSFGGISYRTTKNLVLKARIDSMDQLGVVVVKFSLPIYPITNISLINSDVLTL